MNLFVTDNLNATSNTASANITVTPNETGQRIYDSDGLLGMSPVSYSGAMRGPGYKDCHGAGSHDTDKTLSGYNLSTLPTYTEDRIRADLTVNSHTGGHTTLSGDELTNAIGSLRAFLDSTLQSCP